MKDISWCLPVLCLSLCACAHQTTTFYQDKGITVLEKNTVNFTNVHASHDEVWLEAFGQTYKGVRGAAPYYLEIPGKDSILFVTSRGNDGREATVHILNLKTGNEIHFSALTSGIGKGIGLADGLGVLEKVESVDGDRVVVNSRWHNREALYYLDLQQRLFEKEEFRELAN
jgi:hypothetical protein